MNKSLILTRGIPGSGKSTLAELLSEDGKYPVFSADQFFEKDGKYNFDASKLFIAHKQCQSKTEKAMIAETPKIFVANTFTTEKEMKEYFDLASKHGYKVFSVIVENRHGNKNVHSVPAETLEKMKGRFVVKI